MSGPKELTNWALPPFFAPSTAKVKTLELHTTYPLVATVDDSSVVTIWDYNRKLELRSFKIDALIEASLRDAAAATGSSSFSSSLSSSSSSSAASSAASVLSSAASSALKGGDDKVKDLRWYDEAVLWWSPQGSLPALPSTASPRFLIVLCESKVVLVNPTTLECRPITKDDLMKGTPICVEVLSPSVIAIGCSDGYIRLYDWYDRETVQSLNTQGKKVTHLLNVHPISSSWAAQAPLNFTTGRDNTSSRSASSNGGGIRLRFISVNEDGHLLLWKFQLFGKILKGELSPAASLERLKGNPIIEISYSPFSDYVTALVSKGSIMTSNRRVVSWDLDMARAIAPGGTIPQRSRYGVNTKLAGANLVGVNHPQFPPDTMFACSGSQGSGGNIHFICNVRTTTSTTTTSSSSSSAVIGDDDGGDDDKQVKELYTCPLESIIGGELGFESGKLKAYVTRQHPLQPAVLAVGTNVGAAILFLRVAQAQSFATVYRPPGRYSYLGVSANQLAKFKLTGEARRGKSRVGSLLRKEAIEGTSLPPGFAGTSLYPHPSGRFVAVLSSSATSYIIYEVVGSSGGGEDYLAAMADSGEAVSFAWLGTGYSFAIVVPQRKYGMSIPSMASSSSPSDSAGGGMGNSSSNDVMNVLTVMRRRYDQRKWTESGVVVDVQDANALLLTSSNPTAVFGGPLLCVAYGASSSSGGGGGGGGGGASRSGPGDDRQQIGPASCCFFIECETGLKPASGESATTTSDSTNVTNSLGATSSGGGASRIAGAGKGHPVPARSHHLLPLGPTCVAWDVKGELCAVFCNGFATGARTLHFLRLIGGQMNFITTQQLSTRAMESSVAWWRDTLFYTTNDGQICAVFCCGERNGAQRAVLATRTGLWHGDKPPPIGSGGAAARRRSSTGCENGGGGSGGVDDHGDGGRITSLQPLVSPPGILQVLGVMGGELVICNSGGDAFCMHLTHPLLARYVLGRNLFSDKIASLTPTPNTTASETAETLSTPEVDKENTSSTVITAALANSNIVFIAPSYDHSSSSNNDINGSNVISSSCGDGSNPANGPQHSCDLAILRGRTELVKELLQIGVEDAGSSGQMRFGCASQSGLYLKGCSRSSGYGDDGSNVGTEEALSQLVRLCRELGRWDDEALLRSLQSIGNG